MATSKKEVNLEEKEGVSVKKKGVNLGKKLQKMNISQKQSGMLITDQSGIRPKIDADDKLSGDQISKTEEPSKGSSERDLQRQKNMAFLRDLDNDIAGSYLEQVSIDEADGMFQSLDYETEGDIEFEQTTHSDDKRRLYFGRASYRNVYGNPKRQEDKNWITWETFSAISGMEVSELVRRAEVSDLVLDDRGLARIRSKCLYLFKSLARALLFAGFSVSMSFYF
jgi:hypothetical protein